MFPFLNGRVNQWPSFAKRNAATNKVSWASDLFLDTKEPNFIVFSSFPHREISPVLIITEAAKEAPEIAQNLYLPASTELTFGRTF